MRRVYLHDLDIHNQSKQITYSLLADVYKDLVRSMVSSASFSMRGSNSPHVGIS